MLQLLQTFLSKGVIQTYARKRIDITWRDLWNFIYVYFFRTQTIPQSQAVIERLWSPQQTLATFTARSGFDLCLQACSFPAGSEIIVSAVTIPDMIRIIELNGLVPVPVDVDQDGSVWAGAVEALITAKTRAIVVAHLFGSRMPLDAITSLAHKHELMVIEDCAEAFCGRSFTGHNKADISMFSFGSIKTATALGGGLLTVRSLTLLASMKKIHETYTQQSNTTFFRRMLKYCLFKALTDSPWLYGLFLATLRLLKIDHHVLIRKWSRSFRPDNLLPQIRKRPSGALLRLLQYRITHFKIGDLDSRKASVASLAALLPENLHPVGFGKDNHQYWLCPIRVREPEDLVQSLYRAGFDAADGGTSLAVASTPLFSKPLGATKLMSDIVYVPIDHDYDLNTIDCLASIISRHAKVAEG